MRRTLVAICSAAVAFWFARALGIPAWRTWEIGDASDIALLTFIAVFEIQHKEKPVNRGAPDHIKEAWGYVVTYYNVRPQSGEQSGMVDKWIKGS